MEEPAVHHSPIKKIATISLFGLVFVISFLIFDMSRGVILERSFRVEASDSISLIAKKLESAGIIKYRFPFLFSYYFYTSDSPIVPGTYQVTKGMKLRQIVYTIENKPWAKVITLPQGLTKESMGKVLGEALQWDELDIEFFPHTLSGMQWQKYEDFVAELFTANYEWNKTKTETFFALTALYHDPKYDFFRYMYVPGTYEIPMSLSRAQVAGFILDRFAEARPVDSAASVAEYLDKSAMTSVANLIEQEIVLMPDAAVLPPRDVTLKAEDGRVYLLFTATYWNKGRGPLEIIADPETRNASGDVERKVYQRIYRLDGDYTERLSGTFLWHQTHSHYHFNDFAVYELSPVDLKGVTLTQPLKKKATFCIRDMEPVDLAHPGAKKSPTYSVCGKERQGVSPGWADSYYYNYRDQRFDVTNLPKGTYRLRITLNPEDRFDEITKDNNVGEVLISLDVPKSAVSILEEAKVQKR